MNVRRATTADRRRSASSGRSSRREIPAPPEHARDLGAGVAGRRAPTSAAAAPSGSSRTTRALPGSLRATMLNGRVWHIVLAYIRPRRATAGSLHALMREALAEGGASGSTRVTLDVLVANEAAVAVWRRLGFEPSSYTMAAPLESVAAAARRGRPAVESAPRTSRPTTTTPSSARSRSILPRIGRSSSHGRCPAEQRLDEGRRRALLRDPKALRRLGRELSLAIGDDRADARDRGGRGRPLHPLGPRRDRRRVRLRPGALRPAAARRRHRARRESDRRAAADRRRSRPSCAPSPVPRPRSTSCRRRRSCTRSWPRCSG